MLNTYASKPPGPTGGWGSLTVPRPGIDDDAWEYQRINGIDSTPTGHAAVLKLMNVRDIDSCLGFRLIKTTEEIAVFSDRSNSLNGSKLDARTIEVQESPAGWRPSTTSRMPPRWADALVAFLQVRPLAIRVVARDY
jgi:hypothetical protein